MTPKTIHGVDPSGFLVGFEFNGETIADAVAALLALGVRPLRVQQQPAAPPPPQRPAGPPPPPDDAPPFEEREGPATQPALVDERLPDYRAMALAAKTVTEFDYAAYMTLRNGMYTDQERIGRTRETIVPAWKPGPQSNAAMLVALEVYRDKRSQAEGRGEAATAAHQFAKREAMTAYNEAIKG